MCSPVHLYFLCPAPSHFRPVLLGVSESQTPPVQLSRGFVARIRTQDGKLHIVGRHARNIPAPSSPPLSLPIVSVVINTGVFVVLAVGQFFVVPFKESNIRRKV